MRNRIELGKETVKILTVTSEGKLTKHVKPPIPMRVCKPRHHLQIKESFWAFDKACSEKVAKFKAEQKKLKEQLKTLLVKDQKRAMSNIDDWFSNSLKVAAE